MKKNRADKTTQGMTLDEIRYRKLLTRVKIDMTREQMRMYFDASLNSGNSAQAGKLASGWGRMIQWAEYGVMGFRAYKNISKYLRRIRN